MNITIDTSAILAVLVNEKHKEEIVRQTQDCDLQAPSSLDAEIGNALSAMIKRNRITVNEAKKVIQQFEFISIRRTSIRLINALTLTDRYGIYAYDGFVLDCAKQYRTPLLSLDKKMLEIAKQLHIRTIEVAL